MSAIVIMEQTILFFDRCRLCLSSAGDVNIVEHAADILNCTGVKVAVNDNLPQTICKMCLEVVTKAKTLRTLATKNQNFLHELFSNDDDVELSIDVKSQAGPSESSPENLKNEITGDNSSSQKHIVSTTQCSNQEMERQKAIRVPLDNGEVLYECGTCSKRYKKWKQLYLHQRQHNKTMICPLDGCGKTFATKEDLKRHHRTHTGEKPYSCDNCDKKFAQKVTLKNHKESIHNIFL